MNKVKKILLAGLCGIISLSSFAGCGELFRVSMPSYNEGSDYNSESFSYQKINGKEGYSIIGIGNISDLDIVIPSSYKGLPVMEIGDEAFSANADIKNRNITSVMIPDTVTSIGERTFEDCESLTSVVIGENVTSIGERTFEDCESLTSVVIGENVTSIGDAAFGNKDVLSAVYYKGMPSDWAEISIGAYNADLIDTIRYYYSEFKPKTKGDYWHYVNNQIEIWEIDFEEDLGGMDSQKLVYELSNDGLSYKVVGYLGQELRVIIPAMFEDKPIKEIGERAFARCGNLVEVLIPESVVSIGSYAFSSCDRLISVIIPASVTSLGDFAFYHCDRLTTVVIPDSVTSVGSEVFYGCNQVTIYCETQRKPSGWNEDWDHSNPLKGYVYWYSENRPTEEGNYWHYVDGVVTKW